MFEAVFFLIPNDLLMIIKPLLIKKNALCLGNQHDIKIS